MNKISFHEIEAKSYESPKKQFTTIERSGGLAFQKAEPTTIGRGRINGLIRNLPYWVLTLPKT